MQELIAANILVGDRTYRIRMESGDEEKLRLTMKEINEKILEFKTRFAGKDMQDYLAMVLLWFVTEAKAGQVHPDLLAMAGRIQQLEDQIDPLLVRD